VNYLASSEINGTAIGQPRDWNGLNANTLQSINSKFKKVPNLPEFDSVDPRPPGVCVEFCQHGLSEFSRIQLNSWSTLSAPAKQPGR
jgi:hypothetical protein